MSTPLPPVRERPDEAASLRSAGPNSAVAAAIRILAFLALASPAASSPFRDRPERDAHGCGAGAGKPLLHEMKESLIRRPDLASAKAQGKGHDPSRMYTSINYMVPLGIGGVGIRQTAPLNHHIMAKQENPLPFFVRAGPDEADVAPDLNEEFSSRYEAGTEEWAQEAVDRAMCLLKKAGIDAGDRASIILVQAIEEGQVPPNAATGRLGCLVRVENGLESKYFAIAPGAPQIVARVSGNNVESTSWLGEHAGWFFDEASDAQLYTTKMTDGLTVRDGVVECASDAVKYAARKWRETAFAETQDETMVHNARGSAFPPYDIARELQKGNYAMALFKAEMEALSLVGEGDEILDTVNLLSKAAKAGKRIRVVSRLDDVALAVAPEAKELGLDRKLATAGAKALEAVVPKAVRPLRRIEVSRIGQHYRVRSVPILENRGAVEGRVVHSGGVVVGGAPAKQNAGGRPSSLRSHRPGQGKGAAAAGSRTGHAPWRSGARSEVHRLGDGFVRKDYKHTVGRGYTNALMEANNNAIAFRRLHGSDAARVVLRGTDDPEIKQVSVIMREIPGESLDYLLKSRDMAAIGEALRAYRSGQAVKDMLDPLKSNGITHNDVNLGNIVFDRSSGKFNLVDFDSASINPEGLPLSESQYRTMLGKLDHDFAELERKARLP